MKALPIILGVIILALLAVIIFVPGRNSNNNPVATSTVTGTNNGEVSTTVPLGTDDRNGGADTSTYYSYTSSKGKVIRASIAPNQPIATPYTFTGNVPAGWAFEASFPVEVIDSNGVTIGHGTAKVPSWTSTTTAWYSVTVSYTKPTTTTGTLLIKNDNPSGLPANADSTAIPVKL